MRGLMSARRGIGQSAFLRAVLGAALLAVGNARRIEPTTDNLVAHTGEVLDATTADEHNGVLLEVVGNAGNVGRDLHAVGETDTGNLTKGRVRLLRGGRVDASADAALLWRSPERGCLGL